MVDSRGKIIFLSRDRGSNPMMFEMRSTITWPTRYYVLSKHLEEVTLFRANGSPDEIGLHKCILALIPEEILVVLYIKHIMIHVPSRPYI